MSIKHDLGDAAAAAAAANTKKRTYEYSFGSRDYECERYGQEITAEYFETNIGHGVR